MTEEHLTIYGKPMFKNPNIDYYIDEYGTMTVYYDISTLWEMSDCKGMGKKAIKKLIEELFEESDKGHLLDITEVEEFDDED